MCSCHYHCHCDCSQLPDFSKVDCVHVSFAPLKSTVEDHLQRLGDALLLALRKTVLTRFKEVRRYNTYCCCSSSATLLLYTAVRLCT
jgi:hypothetical protein